MFYTYILQARKDKSFYIGCTPNLKKRIAMHNQKNGGFYTSHAGPFDLVWYSAFKIKELALRFEKYLKSSSGFAFRNKHLI